MNNPANEEKNGIMVAEEKHYKICLDGAVDDWMTASVTDLNRLSIEWGVPVPAIVEGIKKAETEKLGPLIEIRINYRGSQTPFYEIFHEGMFFTHAMTEELAKEEVKELQKLLS